MTIPIHSSFLRLFRFTLCGILFLLVACASPTKHRYREGDNTGQETEMTPQDEQRMTQEVLPKMKKDYPPIKNPQLQSYISRIGHKLVRANKLEGNPYHYNFTVVDVDYVNAFALPAGTIYVTAPLIALAENEAELAGVIGHEIGHIVARHTAERMYMAKKEQKKTAWYAIGGGALGGAAGYALGRLTCAPKDEACLIKAAQVGAIAGAGGGLLIQKYGFMANSREDEMEADRIGFRIAVNAGYSKEHVGAFYEKLLEMEKSMKKGQNALLSSLSDVMSTHPPSTKRVNQMNQMKHKQKPIPPQTVSTNEFENAKRLIARLKIKKTN